MSIATKKNIFISEKLKNADEFEYAMWMTRWLLQPYGIWPLQSSTNFISKFFRLLSNTICIFLCAFLLVPCCLHMFLIEKDLGILLKMIGPLSFFLMNTFKYLAMLMRQREIGSCIMGMASDWHETGDDVRKDLMLANAKTARLVTSLCALFMYGGGMPYCSIMPLAQDAMVVGNDSYQPLAYPSYFVFFNPHIKPIYYLVFFTHILCAFLAYSVTCGVCSFVIMCTMHICSQCSMICMTLQTLTSSQNRNILESVVKQHLRSLRFASKLEEILNVTCLVEMCGCTFNMCMLGYYFITEYGHSDIIATVTYALLLISFTFNIFIFCYIGDLLTEQFQNIGEIAYMISWYNFSSKDARNIILIVASTQRPVVLTAGKMVTLSIRTFCNVTKASMTYLNMLRTLIAN